ncbi:MAG: DUF2953 domain-containing protein [Eubacterium sp.]
MLHILPAILKISGIIIICILCIIIFITLMIVFIPVRYVLKGDFKDESHAYIKATWCFNILKFCIWYDNKIIKPEFKVFGIRVGFGSKKKRHTKRKHHKINNNNKNNNKNTVSHSNNKTSAYNNVKDSKSFMQKIKDTLLNILKKIKDIAASIKSGYEFVTDSDMWDGIRYIKCQIIALLKHAKPTKIKADIRYGFAEPDITGRVLAYISILYGIMGDKVKDISIIPDFENKVFQGNFAVKGRVYPVVVGILLLKVYMYDNSRNLIKS